MHTQIHIHYIHIHVKERKKREKKKVREYLKQGARDITQLAEHLSQNHEDLSSMSRTCVKKPGVVRDYVGLVKLWLEGLLQDHY